MSHTYRLTYQLGDSAVSRVLYLQTGDPQLAYLLEQLGEIRIGQVKALGEQQGEQPQPQRKVG